MKISPCKLCLINMYAYVMYFYARRYRSNMLMLSGRTSFIKFPIFDLVKQDRGGQRYVLKPLFNFHLFSFFHSPCCSFLLMDGRKNQRADIDMGWFLITFWIYKVLFISFRICKHCYFIDIDESINNRRSIQQTDGQGLL